MRNSFWTFEASFASSGKLAAFDQGNQFAFVVAPGCGQGTRCRWRGTGELGQVGEGGDHDAGCEMGEKGGDAQAVAGHAVGVGARYALDEALEAEPAPRLLAVTA